LAIDGSVEAGDTGSDEDLSSASLQDPEIATFEKVALASVLAGESAIDAAIPVSECRKTGASYGLSATP
jgi:hypothetical protein